MNIFASALLIALIPASSMAIPSECPIPGDALHWQADYCLITGETDDIAAVSPCLERESKILFRSTCNQKFRYKRGMCELAIKSGSGKNSVDNCVKDPKFMGPTVRNGGA